MNYKKVSRNQEVIKLLKQRNSLENKIRAIDKNALMNYELQVLGVKPKPEPVKLPWTTKKFIPKVECMVITAAFIQGEWEYNLYQIKKAEGENTKGEQIWYWGLFKDGDEWDAIEDFEPGLHCVLPALKRIEIPDKDRLIVTKKKNELLAREDLIIFKNENSI